MLYCHVYKTCVNNYGDTIYQLMGFWGYFLLVVFILGIDNYFSEFFGCFSIFVNIVRKNK